MHKLFQPTYLTTHPRMPVRVLMTFFFEVYTYLEKSIAYLVFCLRDFQKTTCHHNVILFLMDSLYSLMGDKTSTTTKIFLSSVGPVVSKGTDSQIIRFITRSYLSKQIIRLWLTLTLKRVRGTGTGGGGGCNQIRTVFVVLGSWILLKFY